MVLRGSHSSAYKLYGSSRKLLIIHHEYTSLTALRFKDVQEIDDNNYALALAGISQLYLLQWVTKQEYNYEEPQK
jgi:hypothetical protein